MSGKVYVPIPPRPAGYFQTNPRADLTEDERSMYEEVLAHFTKDSYVLPNEEKGELTEKEKFWLSRECLLRYLRASKWKVATAIQRLESTLKWRREFGIYDLTAEYVEPEAVTGKEIIFGYDVKGRPAFYMIPSRQNTDGVERQNQFAVWMLERGIDCMPPGVETLDLLINFAQRAKHPNFSQARTILSIIQDHYPERLGMALLLNMPFLVTAFLKLIFPFVDPVTREKVKLNPSPIEDGLFEQDMIMSEYWGGSQDFEYVHEKYWPEFVKTSTENAARWTAKWKELGGKIGISEWDYKGGPSSEKEEVDGAVSTSVAVETGEKDEQKPSTEPAQKDSKKDEEQAPPQATPAAGGAVTTAGGGAIAAGAVAGSGGDASAAGGDAGGE